LPSDNETRRLTDQVESLSAQLADLRERVARLEAAKSMVATSAVVPNVTLTPNSANTGLKLLNRIGALTLFIGIIFFFNYAVDNQWIGAAGRVVLGVVAGVLLIGAGEWLRTRAQIVFAQGLDACGIATLYIAAYAACDYYHLIESVVAFVAFLLISFGAVALSLRHNDAFLAAVGYLSGIAAPGLLKLMDPKLFDANVWSWFGFVYLLIANALALWHAGAHKRTLLVAITAAAVVLQAFWLINLGHPIVCTVFFLGVAAMHFRANSDIRSTVGYVVGHLLVLVAGLRFLFFWFDAVASPEARRSLLSETESVFLGVYGVALLIAAVLRKSALDRVLGLAFLGVVIGKLYVVDVWVLTRIYRISAFVALGFILLASSFIYSRWKRGLES
jgi:uncharacterized membrane protein